MLKKIVILSAAFLFLGIQNEVYAHPGNKDKYGGHTCWTNCTERWGLQYGEYHYHNGGGSSGNAGRSSNYSSGPSQKEIAQKQMREGKKVGAKVGFLDGYQGKYLNIVKTDSPDYNKAYEEAYRKEYKAGSDKLSKEMSAAQKAGYVLGQKQDTIKINSAYTKHSMVKSVLVSGFNQAVKARDDVKKKEYQGLGLADGRKDILNEPKNVKAIFSQAYRDGYIQGQSELKKLYVKQGYEAAFSNLFYKVPSLENKKYIDWYKEGYESNTIVQEIAKEVYDRGLMGKDVLITEEISKATSIYEQYHRLGKEQRKESFKAIYTFCSLILLLWLVRRFYVAIKMVK